MAQNLGPGGGGCSEYRRLTIPGLREEVISIICEEWAKGADREIPLNAASISERLQKAGGTDSEAEVQLELSHLIDHGLITLVAEPSSTTDVASVEPELCL